MKLVSCAPRGFVYFALLVVLSLWDANAKPILLRNRVIENEASNLSGSNHLIGLQGRQAGDTNVTGLFLIQLADAPTAVWKDELRALGVELLSFVPENAFVAKVNGANADGIRELEFVRWLGPYDARDKVHPRLLGDADVNNRSRDVLITNLLRLQVLNRLLIV